MNVYRCSSASASVRLAVIATALLLAPCLALAVPITYTGFVITDGQLGRWSFHNARVVLTFESDTKYVQTLPESCVGATAAYNGTGTARVTIVDHEKAVTVRLAPNQIFVAFDQTFGGVGIGSFAPGSPFDPSSCSNPMALQPAYPLGLHHGTMDAAGNPSVADEYSANQIGFPDNLQGNVGFSGKGYTCVGVPQQECDPPAAALKTVHGEDLYLAEPYQELDESNGPRTLNGAFFFQMQGRAGSPLPSSVVAPSSSVDHGRMTYHLLLTSDVSLNGHLYRNATIHLKFRSASSNVAPLAGAGPNGYVNARGVASVDIVSGGHTISAQFARNQIYVYFDPTTASAGFGSAAGGRMYPAALAPTFVHSDTELLAAVADILNNNATIYTPPTADLALTTDLKQETMLAEYVSSCVSFDYAEGVCNDLTTTPALKTDHGAFRLYEPYHHNGFNDPTTQIRSSDNFGIFWTTFDLDD